MASIKRLFDADRLENAIKKRGATLTKAFVDMGRSSNYLSQLKSSGCWINEPTMKLLQALYNIQPEEYLVTERVEAPGGVFNCDDVAEELKLIRATADSVDETLNDIRYVLNIIAADLKIIKHELVPEEIKEEDDAETY